MNDCEQWTIYGMLACLFADGDEFLSSSMRIEADGENMLDEFLEGDAEMYVWLRLQHKRTLLSFNYKRRPIYAGGWPFTIH